MQKQQGKVIAEQQIAEYISFLRENEKSENTIEKYRRDVTRFVQYCRGRPLDKNLTVEYKASLKSAYKTTSINSMLVPVNSFLSFLDREDCRVRLLKCQKKIFCDERDELKKRVPPHAAHSKGGKGGTTVFAASDNLRHGNTRFRVEICYRGSS